MKITTLFSGSSGNCTLVECENAKFLVDGGGSCKKICTALNECGTSVDEINAMFITHEHCDHVSALRVLLKKHKIPVYVKKKCAFASPLYELISGNNIRCVENELDEIIGGVRIIGFNVRHDSLGCFGYTFEENGVKAAVVTDIGKADGRVLEHLRGCGLAVLEANHDAVMVKNGPYPEDLKKRILSDSGHLSNENCALLVAELAKYGLRSVLLAHLSEENNDPSVAEKTVKRAVCECGFDVEIKAAPRCSAESIEC